MDLNMPVFAVIIGLACGILSGFGIGGGSLLMVWMTAALSMELKTAQGINLLYFLPTALAALINHIRQKRVCWFVVLPCAITGCLTAIFASQLAVGMDVNILKKLFSVYLIIAGITEFTKKPTRA